jgi:hypothetical protein
VALDLPAGTLPEGETLFTVVADEVDAVGDVNREKNSASFAVVIDSDRTQIRRDVWILY